MISTIELKGKVNPSWFEQWFDSAFYHQLYAHRSEKEATDFIDELLAELQPPPGSSMLDLGCGAGRHAKYLASKGHNVWGFDLAASSIRLARKSEKENLHFSRQDMRVPFGKNQFHYIFNFFTSFGYFKENGENETVLRNIHRALKPGGVLIMDYLNVEWTEAHLVPEEVKEIDGVIYDISRWADDRYIFKKIKIRNLPEGIPSVFEERVAKFELNDFACLFEKTGLRLEKVFGDYSLDYYDHKKSPRLILIAKKV